MNFEFGTWGRRRARRETGRIAGMASVVGGLAAGAGLAAWFLEPEKGGERRARVKDQLGRAARQASEALQGAQRRAEDGTRRLGDTAGRLRAQATSAAQRATEQAGTVAETARERAAADPRLVEQLAGGVLLARGLFGAGFLRVPFGLLGAATLMRAMGGTERLRPVLEKAGEAARGAAERARSVARPEGEGEAGPGDGAGEQRGGGAGGARGRPEVREVKSPAELEPGIASASPEPTFASRVDRSRDPRR